MLWIKAFHIIAMVTWFAGLFYLPRLFVYHATTTDDISLARFKVMERRLFYGITTPGALATIMLGGWLLSYDMHGYLSQAWMHAKLGCVLLLLIYHVACGRAVGQFAANKNTKSATYYRFFNEFPTLILFAVVILVVVKPF